MKREAIMELGGWFIPIVMVIAIVVTAVTLTRLT
jgi:hypothetical protein